MGDQARLPRACPICGKMLRSVVAVKTHQRDKGCRSLTALADIIETAGGDDDPG